MNVATEPRYGRPTVEVIELRLTCRVGSETDAVPWANTELPLVLSVIVIVTMSEG